jgi:hypothetical protein
VIILFIYFKLYFHNLFQAIIEYHLFKNVGGFYTHEIVVEILTNLTINMVV